MAKEKVTVRILAANDIEGTRYQPNDLVAVDAALAKSLVKDGKADDNKDAVAYVTAEGGKVIEHGAKKDDKEGDQPTA
jgi:hypothetical protein